MKRGLSLLEVLISVALLFLLISGAMSLYEVGAVEMGRAKVLMTEAWLAKGKLDTEAENLEFSQGMRGKFDPPFQDYAFQVEREPAGKDPEMKILTVEVDGPHATHAVIQRLIPANIPSSAASSDETPEIFPSTPMPPIQSSTPLTGQTPSEQPASLGQPASTMVVPQPSTGSPTPVLSAAKRIPTAPLPLPPPPLYSESP